MSDRSHVSFAHLHRLSDLRGLFEHADGTTPRPEHGYCTDDNARLLVVTSRAPHDDGADDDELARLALRFLRDSQSADGRTRNRMDVDGRWTDEPTTEDCWGRSVWGLGTASARHANPTVRRRARRAYDCSLRQRSRWSRAMAFAALGAAEVHAVDPSDHATCALLSDALDVVLGGPTRRSFTDAGWLWPEPRLRYANAALAEAVIAAGAALGRDADRDLGLAMLSWLLEVETRDGHLSVTGAGGRGPHERDAQFDQQPIEVAAMADACWRAHTITGDDDWLRGVDAPARWFEGDNDAGLSMIDPLSGGGYDGLHPRRVNLNQGAESTLALVSTMQLAAQLAPDT